MKDEILDATKACGFSIGDVQLFLPYDIPYFNMHNM